MRLDFRCEAPRFFYRVVDADTGERLSPCAIADEEGEEVTRYVMSKDMQFVLDGLHKLVLFVEKRKVRIEILLADGTYARPFAPWDIVAHLKELS